jgi:hypothetical protein
MIRIERDEQAKSTANAVIKGVVKSLNLNDCNPIPNRIA